MKSVMVIKEVPKSSNLILIKIVTIQEDKSKVAGERIISPKDQDQYVMLKDIIEYRKPIIIVSEKARAMLDKDFLVYLATK